MAKERPAVSVRGQRGRGMGGHQRPSGTGGWRGEQSIEWYTPPGIIDALGLEYDLDPCAPPGGISWIPAKQSFAKADDGLSQPWTGRVWMNPPYGPHTPQWIERFVEHDHGVALVFARTETEWFQRFALCVDAWCLIRGRLTFVGQDLEPAPFNSGAPSVLLACGEECVEALVRSNLGITVGVTERARHAQTSVFSRVDQ